MRRVADCPLNVAPVSRQGPANVGIRARGKADGRGFQHTFRVLCRRTSINLIVSLVWLTTTAHRAILLWLTTEYSKQHLLVTLDSLVRRNASATTCGMRETKGNPVKIRCGRATVIGETLSRRHLLGTGCLRKPLSARCGWEGGESSLSAISQEACLQAVLTALRGESEADIPVNRVLRTKLAECPEARPIHQVRMGVFYFSRKAFCPAP